VKIDVEGHEAEVLRTLAPIFESHKPKVIVFEHYGDLNDPESVVRGILDELGYRIFGIQKKLLRWEAVELEEMAKRKLGATDYMATPK
jgi:hypothetical protein